jgi:putative ABC transport system substrate-binding protein
MRSIRSFLFLSGLATGLAVLFVFVPTARGADAQVLIESTAIIEHPALTATRNGIVEALKAAGYEEGKNLKFVYETAQGNVATAAQIARKFVGDKPNVIVPISTASTQAVVAATRDIPVVFSTVTDPVGAKIVSDMKHPGGNVTGVVDMPPLDQHIALIRKISPAAKRIGIPYNPGESNSITQIKLLRPMLEAAGLTMVEASASKSADVLAAAQSLVGKADVIYVINDNTVVAALESVIKVGIDNKLPVYAGDTDSVQRGAIATLGFSYIDVGRQAGQIVIRVLKGEKPGDIPVENAQTTDLYVNPNAAKKMGVTIPPEIVSAAKKVFD